MRDIWLRYYQEDYDEREYDDSIGDDTVTGGRYDPENTYEPFMFYDFDDVKRPKRRIMELVTEAMNYIPHEFDENGELIEAKVAMSPINDYEYQWHDLLPAELAGYDQVDPRERAQWSRRARRQNDRAKLAGKTGRVHGRELWAIVNRFNSQCAYCGKPLTYGTEDATFDHVIPLALGGESVISNIVPSCLHCNQELNEWDNRNNPEIYSPADRVKYWVPEEFQDPNKTYPELRESAFGQYP